MSRARVLIGLPLPPPVVDALRQQFEVTACPADGPLTGEPLAEAAVDCEGLLVSVGSRIDEPLLARCPRLRVVSNVAVGYDNIDLAACTGRSILVTNTPGVLDAATADLAWALLLAACRRVVEADAYVRAGEWGARAEPFLGCDVSGATLGIVGLGRIGQAVARRAAGFGMPVLYSQRRPAPAAVEADCRATWVDLDELLQRSDIVSLHVPYGPATHHLIGARELGRMKRTAVLVNAARGGIVDDAALLDALRSGRIAAAGLDVFENEPQLQPGFERLRNVVLTPHIGSATAATRQGMVRLAIANLVAALTGAPVPAPVNPEALVRS